MRAFFVIMHDERSDGRAEVPFAKEHQSLQALGLDGLDKAFGERVQIRTPRRKDHGRHTAVTERRRKVAVYSGSRSTMRCSTRLRKPSLTSVRLRATWVIHASSG